MITVGLPAYRAKNIMWLALEGLSRQKTTEKWELLIIEESGGFGITRLKKYYSKLKDAGCTNIQYIKLGKWIPLSQKWCLLVDDAKGDLFILQAADDYPHPDRIQMSADMISNCGLYYETKGYFYDIMDQKMVYYDKMIHPQRHPTGLNMCYRTALLKRLQPEYKRKGVDRWIYDELIDIFGYFGISMNHEENNGLFTQGQNNISVSRNDEFYKSNSIFTPSDKSLYDLLPEEVAERLISMKDIKRNTIIAGKYED